VALITDETLDWIEEAAMVRQFGMHSTAGGLDDQPNKELQILSLIFSELRKDSRG
jgi:hypothetical protein